MTTKELPAKYLRLLAEKYPTLASVAERIICLESQLALPKGSEHFLSDLHGEYESFYHILNNSSGVIAEKVEYVFGEFMTESEKAEFCTLIYYPREKIEELHKKGLDTPEWYRETIAHLLEVAKLMTYKYPARKVKGFIQKDYADVLTELLYSRPEQDSAQARYVASTMAMIVQIDCGALFVEAFSNLIKRLACATIHIVGDFFDRGARPDAIIDNLIAYHDIDIQWGNHDVLWMGAGLGSRVAIAAVIRNSLRYNNTDVLERGYGISLRALTTFARRAYPDESPVKACEKAVNMIMLKLEGALIDRNPDFQMQSRHLLETIDYNSCYCRMNGRRYELESAYFPTIDPKDPYRLTEEENAIIDDLVTYFTESARLQQHLDFLYKKGSLYKTCNGNLLFHGCVPLEKDGSFAAVTMEGRTYHGRAYFDYCEQRTRRAYLQRREEDLDFLWFLWCGRLSPCSGREVKTFERSLLTDESTWKEPSDPYFKLIDRPEICSAILAEFGLKETGHIINGHVPVKVKKGESPIKAGGKAIVVDGGFAKAYHKKTGIAGYTLISNSRGLRLLAHSKVADVKAALAGNQDIESVSETIEIQSRRQTVGDTDEGRIMREEINDLHALLRAYQNGILT
ncbi:fructose-1,6-bisphosphatase [Selenomonas sp. TAMA-11512]|uniref:fructose-1,6-bisphosphatase n=1 Tax=Selenomonas sp. TAMA-11512 TaxID=3095337 RepID=UPI003090B9D7|nr:fructose-1,6-bisphosphatase [Selenomonas sp. TAMA-11512]